MNFPFARPRIFRSLLLWWVEKLDDTIWVIIEPKRNEKVDDDFDKGFNVLGECRLYMRLKKITDKKTKIAHFGIVNLKGHLPRRIWTKSVDVVIKSLVRLRTHFDRSDELDEADRKNFVKIVEQNEDDDAYDRMELQFIQRGCILLERCDAAQ